LIKRNRSEDLVMNYELWITSIAKFVTRNTNREPLTVHRQPITDNRKPITVKYETKNLGNIRT